MGKRLLKGPLAFSIVTGLVVLLLSILLYNTQFKNHTEQLEKKAFEYAGFISEKTETRINSLTHLYTRAFSRWLLHNGNEMEAWEKSVDDFTSDSDLIKRTYYLNKEHKTIGIFGNKGKNQTENPQINKYFEFIKNEKDVDYFISSENHSFYIVSKMEAEDKKEYLIGEIDLIKLFERKLSSLDTGFSTFIIDCKREKIIEKSWNEAEQAILGTEIIKIPNGKRWNISVSPKKHFVKKHTRMLIVTPALGLIFAFLISFLIYQIFRIRNMATELEKHKYHLEDVIKERTEELDSEKERFRTIIEKATVPLCYVNSEGNFVYSNEKFVSTFGYTLETVSNLDQWWTNAYPDKEYRKWVLENWNKAVERAAKENIEIRSDEYNVTCSDGSVKIMQIGGATIGDDFLAVFVDLTDRVKAEKAKDAALEEVKRSNKELEQFAYVASHDLQEPLRMVSSYTQLLAEKYGESLDDKARKYIRYSVDGAIRMQKLINDLLAYSRINTKGQEFSKVDLHSILGVALVNLSKTIEESQAIITNDDLPTVTGDSSQLVQVFQNLIANGIKFHKPDQTPHIHISSSISGNEVQISVKDNGIGIEKEYHDRIFEIFQRLHTRAEYSGTGIGLALCSRIILRHGGKIRVDSQLGEGSVFNFTLKTS